MGTVPFTCDVDFYRARYPDLAHLTAEQAADHYVRHGIDEGRQATALGCRPAFIDFIRTQASILEIGPFCNPTLTGDNVRYLDVLDAPALRARALSLGLDATGCPARIHYIGDIADVTDTFDSVTSSHAIEHQPDLIHHLEGVARMLRPGSGRYCLFVPDKRFCFDHFIPESTIADVIQAHSERRVVHALKSVIEHYALNTHNNAMAHWLGDHGEARPENQAERIATAMALHAGSDAYIDVHAWYFTPTSFWNVMTGLNACGMTALRPVAIYPTVRDTLEFFAILQHD